MTYAPSTRPFYDADSHIMELPDFLKRYADPKLRDEIFEVSYSASLVTEMKKSLRSCSRAASTRRRTSPRKSVSATS